MKIICKENPTILNNFLTYLLAVKNYSTNTVKNYGLDLLCFFRFYQEYTKIEISIKSFNVFILSKVTEDDILAYLVYLNYHRNNNPYTRQRKLGTIRLFFKWLMSTYPSCGLKINPTDTTPSIQKVIRIPKHLTLQQAKQITKVFTSKNSKFPIRNNTIITLFLNAGLRLSELSNLNVNDINFNERYARIIGKGNKERRVPLNKAICRQLLNYIKLRFQDREIIDISEPLFISYRNERLGVEGIQAICKNAFKLMGLEDKKYSTHTLRHSAATILYQYVKPDVLLLKEFLGHSCIESTQIYTHVHDDKIRKAFESNPLNNLELELVG